MSEAKKRYMNLDGLRVVSCLCIIAMHIRANGDYAISGVLYDDIIGMWVHLVALFLMISGFGMFCGYYDKIRNGEIDFNTFYMKRYAKILPFFATLIVIDLIWFHNLDHLMQGLMEATLVFGLLPNNRPDVIGVSWTLGVIFLFYMLFPFVVFLCWNRKRAVLAFLGAIVISLLFSSFYCSPKYVAQGFTPRHNILYCAPWFIGGGLVYLYREEITGFIRRYRWLVLFCIIGLDVLWHIIPDAHAGIDLSMVKNMLLYLPMLMYAVSVDSVVLGNRVTHALSGISMEMYLAQMMVFRAVEKAGGLYLFGRGWVSFWVAFVLVVAGLMAFIGIWKLLRSACEKMFRAAGRKAG